MRIQYKDGHIEYRRYSGYNEVLMEDIRSPDVEKWEILP